jgi:hypothetical protein
MSRSGALSSANGFSIWAIGLSATYLVLAITTHFVLLGIAPALFAYRATMRREKLFPAAIAAAAVAIIVGFTFWGR